MFHLPISTLRYYDKEGLFPGMERQSGIRKFSEREIEALRVIECLKASGLEIREIKQFMEWTTEGAATYTQRKQMFETRRQAVEAEMAELQKTLDMLRYKCWYYDTAIADGNEDRISAMLPDHLPPEIQHLYNSAHA
jgi:DNA-binding transcriptional MerR regulator